MKKIKIVLDEGKPARTVDVSDEELKNFKSLQLLTAKPILYVCNVSEQDAAKGNSWSDHVSKMAEENNAKAIVISAAIEAEIAQLESEEDKKEFLSTLDLEEPGLNKIIKSGYQLLGLQTFFTAGPKEARGWTVRRGAKAPEAAGRIHTDFEKGFIKAEVIAFSDFIDLGGEQACKDAGKNEARR